MSNFKQKYSRIVNREKKTAEILLYGVIGEKIDGDYFAQELNWLGRYYDEITIKINSDGGDVTQGLSIIEEIRSSSAHIITKNVGVAASMAGVIFVCGDERIANDYSRLMLHLAYYADAKGNKVTNISKKAKKALNAINGILTEVLSASGKSQEEITAILTEETWYTANDAVENGFADQEQQTTRKDLAALQPAKLVAKMAEELEEDTNSNNDKSMKRIAARLGLAADATEEQIVAEMEKRENEGTQTLVDQFIVIGEAMGTITDENKEKATRLAKADMEIAVETYLTVVDKTDGGEDEDPKPKGKGVMIKDLVNRGKAGAGGGSPKNADKKWEELSEEEAEELREKDVKAYSAKFKAYYGYEPEVED